MMHKLLLANHLTNSAQVTGRTWRGTAVGGVKGRTELPGLVEGLFTAQSLQDILTFHAKIISTATLKLMNMSRTIGSFRKSTKVSMICM